MNGYIHILSVKYLQGTQITGSHGPPGPEVSEFLCTKCNLKHIFIKKKKEPVLHVGKADTTAATLNMKWKLVTPSNSVFSVHVCRERQGPQESQDQ